MNNSENILNAFLLFKAGSSNDVVQTYVQWKTTFHVTSICLQHEMLLFSLFTKKEI